ncbi:hypothetical protein HMPREF1992_00857 [Selenomonas sp. oral taxon 892 str. F0426]|nr:hypothetical protein HMPREF1992_00857 [Selenomonas sp. oral taxon 892 str. F0426]
MQQTDHIHFVFPIIPSKLAFFISFQAYLCYNAVICKKFSKEFPFPVKNTCVDFI